MHRARQPVRRRATRRGPQQFACEQGVHHGPAACSTRQTDYWNRTGREPVLKKKISARMGTAGAAAVLGVMGAFAGQASAAGDNISGWNAAAHRTVSAASS